MTSVTLMRLPQAAGRRQTVGQLHDSSALKSRKSWNRLHEIIRHFSQMRLINPTALLNFIDVVGSKMKSPGHRFLLLSLLLGLLASSCVSPSSRTRFETPDSLPLLQVVGDLGSNFEWAAHKDKPLREALDAFKAPAPPNASRSSKPQKTANLLFGLMVPITKDGYCLTSAHNLGCGDAMTQFARQIDQHSFGRAYVMVDLKNPNAPLFLQQKNSSGLIVTTREKGKTWSSHLYTAEVGKQTVKVFSRDLGALEFEIMRDQLFDIDAVFCIPLRVLKVWAEDDLALVKVPFPTSSYFSLSDQDAAMGEELMIFMNPGTHDDAINHVTERIQGSAEAPLNFPSFYPLVMRHVKASKSGDSGGPVIKSDGKLVGINTATRRDRDGRAIDLAVGLRSGPIMDAIRASR